MDMEEDQAYTRRADEIQDVVEAAGPIRFDVARINQVREYLWWRVLAGPEPEETASRRNLPPYAGLLSST
jgi:hypothetical protein